MPWNLFSFSSTYIYIMIVSMTLKDKIGPLQTYSSNPVASLNHTSLRLYHTHQLHNRQCHSIHTDCATTCIPCPDMFILPAPLLKRLYIKIPHHVTGIDDVHERIRILLTDTFFHFPHITIRKHGIYQIFLMGRVRAKAFQYGTAVVGKFQQVR